MILPSQSSPVFVAAAPAVPAVILKFGVLTRYCFELVRGGQATALGLGCGITAYNLDDARRMLRQEIFPLYGYRAVALVIEGVEVASLDKQVRLRLGNPSVRACGSR
jgi:hypothetical protein